MMLGFKLLKRGKPQSKSLKHKGYLFNCPSTGITIEEYVSSNGRYLKFTKNNNPKPEWWKMIEKGE